MDISLTDWLFQLQVWGYGLTAVGDITATIAESREGHAVDAYGRALWDDPSRLLNVTLLDAGMRRAIPYWWALPGVVDGLARGALEERRTGYTRVA